MYCDRCNIDFPAGLRYCKWCGQTLTRPRTTSELYLCPSCADPIQPGWAFCKGCGARIGAPARGNSGVIACANCGAPVEPGASMCVRCGYDIKAPSPEPVAARPSGRAASDTAVIAHCGACGDLLEPNTIYCKGCGAPTYGSSNAFGKSSLLCKVCNSRSPLGSVACRVCGTMLEAAEPPASENVQVGSRPRESHTLPDLGEHLPVSDDSLPPSVEVSGANTLVFNGTDQQDSSDPAASQTVRPGVDAEAAVSSDKPNTGVKTTLLAGSKAEHQAPTGLIDKPRHTAPVEISVPDNTNDGRKTESRVSFGSPPEAPHLAGPEPSVAGSEAGPETAAGGTAAIGSESIESGTAVIGSESAAGGTALIGSESAAGRTAVIGSESAAGGTAVIGSESAAGGTAIIGSELASGTEVTGSRPADARTSVIASELTTRQASVPGERNRRPPPPDTHVLEEPGWPSERPLPITGSLSATSEAEVPAAGKKVLPITPVQAPLQKKNHVAIISVFVVLLLLGLAGYFAWWFMAGGRRAPVQRVEVKPPTVEIETPPPPPPTPVAPEGMVLVASGFYPIGRTETAGRSDAAMVDTPQHIVEMKAFYIDRTEVTNAEYKVFIDQTGHPAPKGWVGGAFAEGHENWPVIKVSWQDAVDYATWADKRLPTENEWEAAARGNDGRIYPWGNDWLPSHANIAAKGIVDVGSHPEGASPSGALDMIGNVWEWTSDEFALYPGTSAKEPKLDEGVTYRVIRGGAFDGNREHDGSYRGFVDASKVYDKTGFRCVKSAPTTVR